MQQHSALLDESAFKISTQANVCTEGIQYTLCTSAPILQAISWRLCCMSPCACLVLPLVLGMFMLSTTAFPANSQSWHPGDPSLEGLCLCTHCTTAHCTLPDKYLVNRREIEAHGTTERSPMKCWLEICLHLAYQSSPCQQLEAAQRALTNLRVALASYRFKPGHHNRSQAISNTFQRPLQMRSPELLHLASKRWLSF